ncbi:MAG: DUF3857 domain-containing protein [Bacteroidales bacterium]|nr:DUF3857 domain-containing protein [Bacteroidales bacterium]
MKKTRPVTIFLLSALCIIIKTSSAQNPPIKFGKVSKEELVMKTYDKDTSASAVVLCDYCRSYFDYSEHEGFKLRIERIKRIKIFDKDGYDNANISIPLWKGDSDREKLIKLKGYTFNLENGKIEKEKLSKDGIFEEERHNRLNVVKITMPKVKEGSVIDIEYSISSEFLFNFHSWYFQQDIPVIWNEYIVQIPEYYNYNKSYWGYIPLYINESSSKNKQIRITDHERVANTSGRMTAVSSEAKTSTIDYQESQYRWVAKDVPAFIIEEPLTSEENYISKMDLELSTFEPPNSTIRNYTKSWEDIREILIDDSEFGGQLKGGIFLKDIAEEINTSYSDDREKIDAALEYIQSTMKWNERNYIFVNNSLKSAYKNQTGNCAEINLMLVVLLNKLGFEADPVILSTRTNGLIHPSHPSLVNFNYVIASVKYKDSKILLDATDNMLSSGLLPIRALNGKGRLISRTTSDWINLDPKFITNDTKNLILDLTENGQLSGIIECSRDHYAALTFRKKVNIKEKEEEYIEKLQANYPGLEINSYEFKELGNLNQAVSDNYSVTIEGVGSGGDFIYMNVMPVFGMNLNPFRLENRLYPVEYPYPFKDKYSFTIGIPESYEVDELPQSSSFTLPDNAASYSLTTDFKDGKIHVISEMQLNKLLYLPTDYDNLKNFFNKIIAKHSEQIVIKKK